MDNHQSGYIKIFRSIKKNWIWSDEKKLKWWLDVLLTVNYSDQKVLVKGNLIECKRGQSVRSLDTWAREWLTTKKTVQTFFKLLEKDEMILVENLKTTTRITICNYDSYNGVVNGDDYGEETEPTTESKRSLPPNNKDNKDNKDNKEEVIDVPASPPKTKNDDEAKQKLISQKKKKFADMLAPFVQELGKDTVNSFYSYWAEANENTGKLRWEMEKTWETPKRLSTWVRNEQKFERK